MNQDTIQRAIDLHVHIGPEIIPRKFTLTELLAYEKGKLAGIGVKNHFFPTVSMESKATPTMSDPLIIHSLVLNHFVGGFNADAVRASALLAPTPIIVWFPTIHANNALAQSDTEIPVEWLPPEKRGVFRVRKTSELTGLTIWDSNGDIRQEVKNVIRAILETKAILATGHLSWEESVALIQYARSIGVQKIIVTHPIYQKIDMPVSVQFELAALGAFIEHSFSMYSIDGISIQKIAGQIRAVGPARCILTSDVGQAFSPSSSEALLEFARLLELEGLTQEELQMMLATNPGRLIDLMPAVSSNLQQTANQ